MEYVAHIRSNDKEIQTVEDHLHGVRELAEGFGEKIGVKHIAGLAGLLHDLGKYSQEFQRYIWEAVNHPDAPPRKGSVDHSTAGGRLLYRMLHDGRPAGFDWILAEVVGNAILAHHSYLLDFLNQDLESPYLERARDKQLDEFEQVKALFYERVMSVDDFDDYVAKAKRELETYSRQPRQSIPEIALMFLTKFVFSALIDADRTNTRFFEENRMDESIEDSQSLFEEYYKRLIDKLGTFQEKSHIDSLRRQMSEQCERFALRPSGIYTLSIPTGGGKTLASLRYALKHAIEHGQKRIVYVVPYTTIIEQNAADVRRVLGDTEHVLEHHSNVIEDADENDEWQDGRVDARQRLKLAKDNWDAPIIFTTMVQFLNVFYAKGSRNTRRLHNLSESVIVFDEVQKVPTHCVSLFNAALQFLNESCHSSIVLCTATQPALNEVKRKLQLSEDPEMISDLDNVINAFKRVDIVDRATDEEFTTERLADFVEDRIEDVRSVLVILNTKTVVKRLFQRLEHVEVPVYHLSTSMCAAHRNDILEKVKEHLNKGEKVVCISTQLIEAGVDVSFDCVIRSLAGLDSIAQAAGRCNRHGKNGIQKVYVIDHVEEKLDKLKEIQKGKSIAKKIFIDLRNDANVYGGHLLSRQAMERYFQEFYDAFELDLDYPMKNTGYRMTELLLSRRHKQENVVVKSYEDNKKEAVPLGVVHSHRTAAERFEVIEQFTDSVIVPYGGEGKEIIAQLNGEHTIEDLSRLLKRAQQYTVNLFDYEKKLLDKSGGLTRLFDGKVLALKDGAYNQKFGVDLSGESEMEELIW